MGKRRSLRIAVVAGALAAFAIQAACADKCENGRCSDKSDTRLIERACGPDFEGSTTCTVGGDAYAAVGITADSNAYELGPGGGTITIHLAVLVDELTAGSLDMDVLVAARRGTRGSTLTSQVRHGPCVDAGFGGPCTPDPPLASSSITSEAYAWIPVITSDAALLQATDPTLTLTGRDLDIADIRAVTTFNEFNCSIARPIGSRP